MSFFLQMTILMLKILTLIPQEHLGIIREINIRKGVILFITGITEISQEQ